MLNLELASRALTSLLWPQHSMMCDVLFINWGLNCAIISIQRCVITHNNLWTEVEGGHRVSHRESCKNTMYFFSFLKIIVDLRRETWFKVVCAKAGQLVIRIYNVVRQWKESFEELRNRAISEVVYVSFSS